MDLKTLREEGNYPGSEAAFRRFVLKSEKKGLVSSVKDPTSKRKFVHLTKNGERHIGLLHSTLGFNDGTFHHDSRLSIIARKFLEFEAIRDVELEHDLLRGKRIGRIKGHIPDAVLYGKRGENNFTVALELELTAKSKTRYLEKCRYYVGSSIYDYALYFFSDLATLKNYKREIVSALGPESQERLLLAYNTNLYQQDMKFEETEVFYMNEEVRIDEII